MKKMVSLLLCLSMVMALSVPAFAASEPVPHDEVIRLQEIGITENMLWRRIFLMTQKHLETISQLRQRRIPRFITIRTISILFKTALEIIC